MEVIVVVLIFVLIGVFVIAFAIRRDKINPPITVRNNHLEIIGFLKNKIINASEIKNISMVFTQDEEEDFPLDLISFEFELLNGKSFTLKENLNPQGFKEAITGKEKPTLSVFQLKELINKNPQIQIDQFTKSYLESGNCELFLKSRQA